MNKMEFNPNDTWFWLESAFKNFFFGIADLDCFAQEECEPKLNGYDKEKIRQIYGMIDMACDAFEGLLRKHGKLPDWVDPEKCDAAVEEWRKIEESRKDKDIPF